MKTAPTAIRPGPGKSQLPQGLPYELILLIQKFPLSIKTYDAKLSNLGSGLLVTSCSSHMRLSNASIGILMGK